MGRANASAEELVDRLIEVAEDDSPQVRAVVMTLLIRGLEFPDARDLLSLMVRSDAAGALADPAGATDATLELHARLRTRLLSLAAETGATALVRTLRDYLLAQMQRWASSAVDDADNRRRAERLLFLADHPGALRGAQRSGLLAGLSGDDVRELARTRIEAGVSPETATLLWSQLEHWRSRCADLLPDRLLGSS